MRKLTLTLALILCGYAVSNASIITKNSVQLAVGSNPVSILENPNDGSINIFCAGIDANDNNVYDEGEDEKPTLWTYNPNGNSEKAIMVMEFDNYFVSPFKPTFAEFQNGLYFGIPMKCSTTNGDFSGNGKLLLVNATSFVTLFDVDQPNSEVLFASSKSMNAITITRYNGQDSLSLENIETNVEDNVQLNGDAIDATLVDLDGDGIDEIAILLDNEKIAFYKFGATIQFITQYDLTSFADYSGEFGHFYSYENNIYTTFGNKGTVLKISADIEGNVDSEAISYYDLDELYYPKSFYPVNNNTSIITNSIYNLIVRDGGAIAEMHRTTTPTDFVYANETTAYITGDKSVYIYDITNDKKLDQSYKAHGYVGYQPLDIFPYGDDYYTVNLGVDFNFDGEIDELAGDQKASINQFDLKNPDYIFANNYSRINFDFPINFPLNTNMSSDGDLTLPSGNSVYYYNVANNEVYDSFDAGMYVSTVFRVLDYLVLGQRDYAENKSYVRIKKGEFIDVKTEVGLNVVDLIVYQNATGFGVVSLSEGTFGGADAKLNIVKLSTMGIGENTEIAVGATGSGLVANADQTKAAVVMNGSHEVHILNLLTGKIDLTFSTGTSGYAGPRDAKFVGDLLYVTTYSNQILVFNYITGKKVSSIAIDGNTEGLLITDKYILAANINYSNYQQNNRIFAYDLDKITSVEESTPSEQTIRVYPNPVANDFHLVSDDLAGTNDIAIINSQGKIVATYSGSSNGAIALNADALGLTSGNYTAVINGTRAVRFVVIK
jgi:hypothetical protein